MEVLKAAGDSALLRFKPDELLILTNALRLLADEWSDEVGTIIGGDLSEVNELSSGIREAFERSR